MVLGRQRSPMQDIEVGVLTPEWDESPGGRHGSHSSILGELQDLRCLAGLSRSQRSDMTGETEQAVLLHMTTGSLCCTSETL